MTVPDEILDFTRELVATPSQNGIDNECAVAKVVFEKLQSFGFSPERVGPFDRPSAVCRIDRPGATKTIWLESCLDTVTVGDRSLWHHDPFASETANGRLYGRGVADAKVGIALFCFLARELARDPSFRGSLFLGFDADEQSGRFSGAREIVKIAPRADICVLGYQTDEEISIGARGFVRLRLVTHGRAAHTGARSQRGVNAVHAMGHAIAALAGLRLPAASVRFFEFGSSLHVAQVRGGMAINVVPDTCEAFVDMRIVPGQEPAAVVPTVRGVLDVLGPKYTLEVLQEERAFLTDAHHPFVRLLKREAERILGRPVPLTASGQGSVGSIISTQGVPVINAFGVRSGNGHMPDEWIALDSIQPTFEIYRAALTEFAAGEGA